MSSNNAKDFLDEINKLVSSGASKSTRSNNVNFNMRINEGLKDDFDRLCKDNHTTMTAEVKRFIRLAVDAQKL